jgi:hypothetical protein
MSERRLPTLAARLGRLGISRLCPLGQMAFPTFAWHHDGRGNLMDLVRFCDVEPPSHQHPEIASSAGEKP